MSAPIQTDRAPVSPNEGASPTQTLIATAIQRFQRAQENESLNRQEAMEDDKFRAGDQWPSQIKSDRTIQKRPCLTINKMATFVHQIVNEHRMNRPAINIAPVGDRSDPETAKMLKGMIRQIERISHAEVAYDTGFESAVTGGWGFWRIYADYEDEDTFDQSIMVERIPNRFSVYMDPAAKMPTGADCKWCFISEFVPREEFERDYPNADPVEWTEYGTGDQLADWSTQTHLRVAEYYYFETRQRTLIALKTGHIGYEDQLDPAIREELARDETMIANKRKVNVKQLKWCKLTAKDILDEEELPGKWIPVVRCIGDETVVEGKTNYAGVVRYAKDPQRMYNYWSTAETEMIALQPKAPWIMEEGQVEGHEKRWQQANITSFPYLLYKGTSISGKAAPPPQRQPFAGSPDGVVKAKIGAAQDMQATTGVRFDATIQERMNDESGTALVELKKIGEMGQFHFTDNFQKALQHTGEIFIDLIPSYYDTKRVITILRDDDTEEQAAIDPLMQQGTGEEQTADGKVRRLFNPNVGKYSVAVTTGPNFATKRVEAAEQQLQFLKVVPQAVPLIGDIVAKNMDWPDAEIIAERLASQLPPQLLMKETKNIEPKARAIIGSLQTQIQKLGDEHKQALNLLGEKEKEQAMEGERINIERESVANIFQAKMADVTAKVVIAQEKADAERKGQMTDIVGKMADIELAVQGFIQESHQALAEHGMRREEMEYDRLDKDRERRAKDDEKANELKAALAETQEMKKLLSQAMKKPKIKAIERVRGKAGMSAKVHYEDGSSREVALH